MTPFLSDADLTSFRLVLNRLVARQRGYTLVELLVVVVILGLLSAIGAQSYNSFLRRERVNAVALALYGWLSEVRQASLRLQSDSCTISFQTGTRSVNQQLATIQSGSSCEAMLGIKSSLSLDRELTNGLSAQLSSSAASVSFTPRTLTTNTEDIVIGLVVNSQSPQHCVRISAVSGFVQVGRNDSSSSTAGTCSYPSDRRF